MATATTTENPDAWAEAYERVESYFGAMRVGNPLVLSRMVSRVLEAAEKRYNEAGGAAGEKTPTELAAEEVDRTLEAWFYELLGDEKIAESAEGGRNHLPVEGRLALSLIAMPQRWQAQFLGGPPWPEELVQEMRDAYLTAGPEFQVAKMERRPIELGPVAAAARTWNELDKFRRVKKTIFWGLLGLFAWGSYLLLT